MAPKKDMKRKVPEAVGASATVAGGGGGTSSKSSKSSKLMVSGVDELKKQLKAKKNESIEELEIKAQRQGENTVEGFTSGLADIRKMLPNLKSLSLDASQERDECEADVLKNIFKTWEGSNTLEAISLNMDWAQFKELDQVLTGFSKADCLKLKDSLGNTKNIPTTKFKKSKYSLASLPGLKKLDLILCDVERIDETGRQIYNKLKFEIMTFVLNRYLFSKMRNLKVNIKLLDGRGGYDSEDYYDSDYDNYDYSE